MKQTRILMGMTINVEIADQWVKKEDLDAVFDYFNYVDEKFSTYKDTSEITKINRGLINESEYSDDMKTIFRLCGETKDLTHGYFDINCRDNTIDPSGLVKGWAINNAANLIKERGFENYFVDAGGDVQVSGFDSEGKLWKIGILDPFSKEQKFTKIISTFKRGVATSGTYLRGQHIYNPHDKDSEINDIVSLTVVGPNIYEADRFATAAFAMGKKGILFIEGLSGFEGYMIDKNGIATLTSNFNDFINA